MADIFDEMWEAQIDQQEARDEIIAFEQELQFFHYIGFRYSSDQIRELQHEKGLLENREFDAVQKLKRLGEQYDQMIYEDELSRREA